MDEIRTFDKANYEWFLPQGRKLSYTVSFTVCGKCNISSKLLPLIPASITIGICCDGKEIVLAEKEESGYKLPKSGSLRDPNLTRAIVERGISLPARYQMKQLEDGVWIGTLCDPPQAAGVTKKPIPKRPRKSGLAAMMPVE